MTNYNDETDTKIIKQSIKENLDKNENIILYYNQLIVTVIEEYDFYEIIKYAVFYCYDMSITGLNKRNSSKLFIKSILSYSPLRLRGFNLMDIVCEPNKGYGTALMKALLKYIENYNIEYIDGFLSPVDTADKSDKQRLLHFYSKFGFEIDEHNRIKKIFEKIPKTLDFTPK